MRVLAAMSGGVDSSVAAARMVDAGHDVVGVHLALSSAPGTLRTGSRGCCSKEDAGDAGRVAGGAEDVAPRDVDLVGQGQGDRLAGHGAIEVAVLGDDAGDGALAAGRGHLDPIAGHHRPGGDEA